MDGMHVAPLPGDGDLVAGRVAARTNANRISAFGQQPLREKRAVLPARRVLSAIATGAAGSIWTEGFGRSSEGYGGFAEIIGRARKNPYWAQKRARRCGVDDMENAFCRVRADGDGRARPCSRLRRFAAEKTADAGACTARATKTDATNAMTDTSADGEKCKGGAKKGATFFGRW